MNLIGHTVTKHYWTVVSHYGTNTGEMTEGDAFLAAMETSREFAGRYDLTIELQASIAENACVVTIEERAMFTDPNGGGIEREIHRLTVSWLRPHDRERYDAVLRHRETAVTA